MSEHFEIRLCEDILTDTIIFGLLNTGLAFFVTFIFHSLQPIPKCSIRHQLSILNLVTLMFFCEGAALKFIQLFLNSPHNRGVRWSYLNNRCCVFFPCRLKGQKALKRSCSWSFCVSQSIAHP